MEFKLETRKKLYELIKDSPGIHLRELERRLGLVVGSLQYHLHYLEKNKLISSFKDGEYVRYFATRKLPEKRERDIISFLRRKGARHILIKLLQTPGTNNKELSTAVGLSPSTVSWHLDRLAKSGIIEKCRKGRINNLKIVDPKLTAELLIFYKESFPDSFPGGFPDGFPDDFPDYFIRIWTKNKER